MSYPQPPYPSGPYQQGPPWQPPPAPQQSSRRPLLLAGLAGFVLAAVIALVLSFAGALPGGDDDANGTSSASISLPDQVASYVRYSDVTLNKKAVAKRTVANIADVDTKTAQALSDAHSGAGADVQTYASQDLMVQFEVWAVRGSTPPPVIPYQSAAFVGLAQPMQVVRKVGNSWCSLYSVQSYRAGTTPPADSYLATFCQRSDGHLTVVITGGSGNAFSTNPARVAKAVDEVWDAVS